jgi:peptide/nickel transport system substrate-binding protein
MRMIRTPRGPVRPRHLRRKGVALLAVGAASAIALAGCSSSGSTGAATSTGTAGTDASRSGNVASLTSSMPAALTGIDPMKTSFQQDVWVLHLVGGTLFAYVPGTNDQTVPALASSSSLSSDGKTATVTLKPGLKFSDGTPLTAADVAGTFEHDIADQKATGGFIPNFVSAAATNATTVVINFNAPDPDYKADLALFPLTIVPNGSWSNANFSTSLISDGPYTVSGALTGNKVVLLRNPNYPGPKPSVAKLDMDVIADPTAALNELETKQIDMDSQLTPANATSLPSSLVSRKVEAWLIDILTFNTKLPLLNNLRIREAIGYAIDRTQLNEVGNSGQAEPWGSEISPNFPASSESWAKVFPVTADVAKAKQLLQGTPCASGCTISTNVIAGTYEALYAVAMQQELSAVGIKFVVNNLDPDTYNTRNFAGQYQTLLTGTGAFTPSADLNLSLNPDGPTMGMFSHYSSPSLVKAVLAAESSVGTGGETGAFQQLASVYDGAVQWVPLTTGPALWASTSAANAHIYFSPTGLLDVSSLG